MEAGSEANSATDAEPGPARKLRVGLSGKLLFLTILFVMVAEVLIYVPSVANFRLNWLNDRLAAAHTAALVLDAAPSGMVPESLANQILKSIGARAVALKMGNQRRLLAASEMPSELAQDIDMREVSWWRSIIDAFDTLLTSKPGDVIRVVGAAPMGGDFLEIILDEAPLYKAMWTFSVNILLLSLAISGITAMLVFFALHYLLIRPMWRITRNMVAFRADPENPLRIIAESGRRDEVGIAEEELAAMQRELASMLHQQSRLAALGLAVSKINHDLRNLLASAQIFSDQLSTLPDPKVQRFAPKLMRALERAIAFCQSTLSYGAAQEPPPDRKTIEVEPLVEEVHEALGLTLDVPETYNRADAMIVQLDGYKGSARRKVADVFGDRVHKEKQFLQWNVLAKGHEVNFVVPAGFPPLVIQKVSAVEVSGLPAFDRVADVIEDHSKRESPRQGLKGLAVTCVVLVYER